MSLGYVHCERCGSDTADADTARELQFTWCLPNKRYAGNRKGGSHSDPQELYRTDVYICARCWACRVGKFRQRTLWGFLHEMVSRARQAVHVWIPATTPTDQFDFDQRTRKKVIV